MTFNTRKLLAELQDLSLTVNVTSVNANGDVTYDDVPTSGDLAAVDAAKAVHDPTNQITLNASVGIAGMITKAINWRDYFRGIVTTDFSSMPTADQNTVIKRLIYLGIYVLEQFLEAQEFTEDPP